jgi:hypothetical protein
MTFGKFFLSSFLVSTTFAMSAYILLGSMLEGPEEIIQRRGVLYLALLPYFLGALINKEGYWERSEALSELLNPSQKKKRSRALSRVMRVALVVLLFGAGIVAYQIWGSDAVKGLLLLLLGAIWGGVVMRAWFIYQEGLASASRRTR